VQSQVDNNLWQVDPAFKVQFFTSCQSPFVWFSSRIYKFEFGPNTLRDFCKENDYFDFLE
jgi:hypothetical protein